MAGTFVIQGAGFVSQNNAPARGWGGDNIGANVSRPTNNAALLAGINSTSPANPSLFGGWVSGDSTAVGTWLIRFFFGLSDNVIALDGNPAISFNNLPAGIEILTATLQITVSQYSGANPDGTSQLFLQQGPLTESANLGQQNVTPATKLFPYVFGGSGKGRFIDVLLNGFGIRMPITQAGSIGQQFWNAKIVGSYDLSASSSTFNPVIQNDPTVSVFVGDKVKINSASGGLQGTTQIQLSFTDPVLGPRNIFINTDPENPFLQIDFLIFWWLEFIIIFEPFTMWFYIPWGFKKYFGPVFVYLIGDGVQFSGSVLAGMLQIRFADFSGVYQIIDGQTNDVLYFRGGFTTTNSLLFLPNMLDDEIYDDDFFYMLGYPQRILSQNDIDEDFEIGDYSMISNLQLVTNTKSVEIPSPFVKTGFMP